MLHAPFYTRRRQPRSSAYGDFVRDWWVEEVEFSNVVVFVAGISHPPLSEHQQKQQQRQRIKTSLDGLAAALGAK